MAALRFVQQPASTEALVPSTPIRLELLDIDGGVTPVSGARIDVEVAPNPSGTRVVGEVGHLSTDGIVQLDAIAYDRPGRNLRLVASGGSLGTTSEPFEVRFTRPVVALRDVPSEVESCASIPYTLTQAQGHSIDLLVEVDPDGPDGPATFVRARQAASDPGVAGVQGAPASATGLAQTFAWNSSFDVPGDADVTLRLTPRVGGAVGASVTSPLVHVANGLRFQPSHDAVPGLSLLRVADVDRDGWPDSIAVVGTSLTLRYGGPDGARAEVVLPGAARDVTVGDFDADGLQDLAVATSERGIALVTQVRTPRRQLRSAVSVDGSASVRQVAAADLDHDGLVDLVAVHDDGEVIALRQTGSSAQPLTPLGTAWNGGATGRIALIDRAHQRAFDVVIGQTSGPAVVVTWEAGHFAAPRFESFVIGGEVVAADIDRDGEADLVSLSSEGLRIQLGGAATQQLGPFPGVTGTHLLVGDVDADGSPDMIVTSTTSSVIFHLDLDAVASGAEPVAELDDAGAVPVAVVDANRDGRLDLIAANVATGQVMTYAAVTPRRCGARLGGPLATGASAGTDSAVADVDSDGKLDLLYFDGGLELASGLGDGSFAAARTIAESPADVLDFVSTDLDEDGAVDLVYVDAEAPTVKLLYHDSGGAVSFTPETLATEEECPQAVTVADLDADGQLDVAVLGSSDVEVFYSTSRREHLFAAPSRLSGVGALFGCRSTPARLVAVDINGDGRLELVATGYSQEVVFPADPADPRRFLAPVLSEHPTAPLIAVADVVGDARPELILKGSRSGHDELQAFTFAPDFTTPAEPTWFAIYPGPAMPSDFLRGSVLELDGDGALEVATGVGPEGSLGIAVVTPRHMASGGQFAHEWILPVNGRPHFADVDADGVRDLVSGPFVAPGAAPAGRFDAGTWLGPLGKETASTPFGSMHVAMRDESSLSAVWLDGGHLQVGQCARPAGPCQLGVALPAAEPALLADLDHDGRPDVVAAGTGDEVAFLADPVGDGFAPVCPVAAPIQPRAVADLDNDGQPDLLLTVGLAVEWIRAPASTCSPAQLLFSVPPPFTGGPIGVEAADLNTDGLVDVVVVGDQVHVALQSAAQPMTFPTLQHYGPFFEPFDLDIGDVDRDGLPDLIVNSSEGPLLYRSDPTKPGRLSSGGAFGVDAIGDVHDLLIADIDADGWLDLFDPFDGTVMLQTASMPGHFQRTYEVSPSTLEARDGTGPWALLDFDGDGRLDQLVWRAESGVFLERGR